jgi:hypothetical protein
VSLEAAYVTRVTVDGRAFARWINKGVPYAVDGVPRIDTYLEVQNKTYGVTANYELYDRARGKYIHISSEGRKALHSIAWALKTAHYGRSADWEEAQDIIPKMAKFTVQDMETGLQFNVQRRAGSNHADVQPLTAQDSAIMKQIYGGEWSWKRRAIIVIKDEHRLAASMHGKPHGGDGIPGNDFDGHFCIHFLGSTTHGSGKLDLDHQVMVHKASGTLDQYLTFSPPEDAAATVLVAAKSQDEQVLRALFERDDDPLFAELKEQLQDITNVKRSPDPARHVPSDALQAEVTLLAQIERVKRGMRYETFKFVLTRGAVYEPWHLQDFEVFE